MGTILRFDVFELDTRALELKRDGAPVYLRPQPCRLLACLARRAGVLVTRDELRDQLWPTGMFVRFDLGLNSCVKQVRTALDDRRAEPRFIETLPRRGYRFLTAVTEATRPLAASRRPRLAVLPFSAIDTAGSDKAPLVTEGFAEELTTRLACLRPDRLGILACVPAGTNGRPADVAQELDADYLIKGSIRRAGGRLRITAHLINVHDKLHVWARSYEPQSCDPLLWQDEAASTIAREIVGTFRLPTIS